jgi:benzoate-CoA ligase family protein
MIAVKTAADLGIPERFNAASHFVDRHLQEGRGAKVAIECGDERVTYAELFARVNRCGSALRDACGVARGDRVVLLLHDGPAFFYAFFGAIKIGAVPVPINTLWKTPDYRFVLRDSAARVLIVSEVLHPLVDAIPRADTPDLRHVIVVDRGGSFERHLDRGSPALDAAPTRHDDPAFWLYSSGSTGTPKGCVHLQHDMVVCAELYAKAVLEIDEHDRFFSVPKLFFAYGLGNGGYFPLAAGATSILWPGAPTPADVYAVIERHRPTLIFFVPTGFGMMLATPGAFDLSSVRFAVSAGEALPEALYVRFKERFGVDILDAIGSTEALHMFIANRPNAIRAGSSGLLLDGYDAMLLDERRQTVACGDVGDLYIRGEATCREYWNQPENTAATIQDGWLRTGDKYTQDEDGFYWYAGRGDDMLKVGGLWVSPVEVEAALVAHEAVQECAVVGCEDGDGLTKPYAFVVLRAGVARAPSLGTDLQQFVRSKLAEYKRPRWVEFRDELPKTATGKMQRFKLRDEARMARESR